MKSNPQIHSRFLIREARAEDAPDVVRLIRQLGEESEINEEYVLHYLAGRDRNILLAQCNPVPLKGISEVQGLLSYSVRADLYHGGNSVLIEELVVDQGCRGQGIGSALMEALIKRLPGLGCKEVCLAVMPENEEAIRFYQRHGLVEEALFLERHFRGTREKE